MKIDTDALKKQVILHLPYLLFLLVFAKLGEAVRLAPGADASQKLLGLSEGFTLAFQSMWPGAALDWLVGLCGAVIVRLAVYLKGKDAKKYRKNVEYGSARWGNKTDIAPFMDPKPENNIILTQTEGLMMSGRPKNPAHARNKNVLVVGGSGSGKTRFFIKPNLMQMHSSYVVTDPKGTVLIEVGKLLSRGTPKLDKDGNPVRGKNGKIVYEPYKIKVFNTINFSKSMHYNPFAYIHNEKDILKLVTVLIANTKGEGKSGDDFWVKAETLLYTALIGYIYYEAPTNEQNFSTLVEMINAMEVREDDESFKNAVDLLFDALEQKDPDHFALRQYKKYKLAAGKTAKSILISCGARLAPFDIKEVREITMYDELELDLVGDRKQEHEILLEQQMDTAYKTLDIEGILKKCRTVDDIITALQGMDDYWKRTCEHASSVINRDKKFMSEKASYESRVRKMEQELEECQKKIQDIQADAKRYEQENIYLRRILKTHLYPALANELLRESNLPVPDNTSVRPESFEKLIDGKFPSAFEGAQGVSEKKPDWKERLQNALESQVDKNGR